MAGRAGRRARPLVVAAAAALLVAGLGPAGPARVPALARLAPARPAPEGAGTGSGGGSPVAAVARPPGPRGGPRADAPRVVSLEVPGENERVSLGPKGEEQPSTQALDPAISSDGRYVAYRTITIVGSQSAYAVRLHDRSAGTTIQLYPLEGSASDGFPLNPGAGILGAPAISADGQYVAFAAATSTGWRILMWGAAEGIFAPFAGTTAGRLASTTLPSLSGDGRYVGFLGSAGATLSARVPPRFYLFDRVARTMTIVGVDEAGAPVGSTSSEFYGGIAVSADGTRVAFSDLSPRSKNTIRQVWLRDVGASRTTLLSATPAGAESGGSSWEPAISADGTVVAFSSSSSDLVAGDGNGRTDVYAWREGSGLRRVSATVNGADGSGASDEPAISADGRHVAFTSSSDNLVPGDTTGPLDPNLDALDPTDVFAVDLVTGYLARVSVGLGPREPDGSSSAPSLSRNGRYVAFQSRATNLVEGDTNGESDAFVRNRIPELTLTANPTDFGAAPVQSPPGVTRTVTVTSTGGSAARVTALARGGANASDFLVTAETCTNVLLYPGQSCTVQVLFLPLAGGARSAELQATATTPTAPVPAALVGRGGVGSITVSPPVGPPGIVAIVTGAGFPPATPISLGWSAGITPTPLEAVVTDAKGGFVAQLLVMPGDVLGPRLVQAAPTGGPVAVAPATARFLVVASTAGPPIIDFVQVFRDELGRPIILRR